jgi:hypothetical protein
MKVAVKVDATTSSSKMAARIWLSFLYRPQGRIHSIPGGAASPLDFEKQCFSVILSVVCPSLENFFAPP